MMTRKQCQDAMGLISRITRLGYTLSFDANEVTIYDAFGPRHAHHGGATRLQQLQKAWATAQEYEKDYEPSPSSCNEEKP
jgi:hypothetical protein